MFGPGLVLWRLGLNSALGSAPALRRISKVRLLSPDLWGPASASHLLCIFCRLGRRLIMGCLGVFPLSLGVLKVPIAGVGTCLRIGVDSPLSVTCHEGILSALSLICSIALGHPFALKNQQPMAW